MPKNQHSGNTFEKNPRNKIHVIKKVCCIDNKTEQPNLKYPIFIDILPSNYTLLNGTKNTKNKKLSVEWMQQVNKDIEKYAKLGHIILLGDFNARTGTDQDTINLELDHIKGIDSGSLGSEGGFFGEEGIIPFSRNSEDGKTNQRGKEILEMCKNNDLCILNGRTVGDVFGAITCRRWNGCSVVDYCICSQELVHNVISFEVSPAYPWFSDHSAIQLHISIFVNATSRVKKEHLGKLPDTFIWDSEAEIKTAHYFASEEFALEMHNFGLVSPENAGDKLESFCSLLRESIDRIGIKKRKMKIFNTSNSSQPWFDQDCEKARAQMEKLARSIRGGDKLKCKALSDLKKNYRKMLRKKKTLYFDEQLDELANNFKTPTSFWKKLKNLRNTKQRTKFNITEVLDHFKVLLNSKTPPSSVNPTQASAKDENDSINGIIKEEETDSALGKAKRGKAPGIDGLIYEMIFVFHKAFPNFLTTLFNAVFASGSYPALWSRALIVLVHKKGPESSIDNYRGISLLCTLSKIFCSILNNRLNKWSEENKLLTDGQLGFRKGNRTSDALLILHNVIDFYCQKGKKNLFGCFVDFTKAFDTIPRDKLLSKLSKLGINGKMFDILNSMYSVNTASFKINGGLTSEITINQGVKQGCVLSPTVFNLYMSDFEPSLKNSTSAEGPSLGDTNVTCILWADDILMLSESARGLQNQMAFLERYSEANQLQVNIKKTKWIHFNKKGIFCKQSIIYQNECLEQIDNFSYLGFLVNNKGNVSNGIKNLQERAMKAYFKMKNAMHESIFRSPKVAFRLFDSILKPILLYASDFWGLRPENVSDSPVTEQMHTKFCKWLLGVSKRTSNFGVLSETERYPIAIDAQIHCFNNWVRILGGNGNELLYKCTNEATKYNLKDYQGLKRFLEVNKIMILENYLPYLKYKSRTADMIKTALRTKFEIQCNRAHIFSEKLALLKVITNQRLYVQETNLTLRSKIAKLRLSDHHLEIEQGRYYDIGRDRRICKCCGKAVEDVGHFLIACKMYDTARNILFQEIAKSYVGFLQYSVNAQISVILNPTQETRKAIFVFLQTAHKIRDETLQMKVQ